MKIVVDMNLPPDWCLLFEQQGWKSAHWSNVGDPKATDAAILGWARVQGFVVFTHDLDYGALLAATQAKGPSVIQIRAQDIMPEAIGSILIQALRRYESVLEQGAFISIDESRARIRILPLGRRRE